MDTIGHRGNRIDIESDGNLDIRINDVSIEAEGNEERTRFATPMAFGEFDSPGELARAVVDTQTALEEPHLELDDVTDSEELPRLDVRRNVADLAAEERNRFRDAVFLLKERGEYDKYIKFHGFTTNLGHSGPAFYPWHRVFLRKFERELQATSLENVDITLPYWDYTSANVDEHDVSKIWREDFFGLNGYVRLTWIGEDGEEKTWILPGYRATDVDVEEREGIRRNEFSLTSRFVAPTVFNDALRLRDFRLFAREFEGRPHSGAHVVLGVGNGNDQGPPGGFATAVNDPFFLLLHCNIDRMWAKWQQLMRDKWLADNPDMSYPVTQLAEDYYWDKSDRAHTAPHSIHAPRAKEDRHNLTDALWPWDASRSHSDRSDSQFVDAADREIIRPLDRLNHHDLGYTYDNLNPTGF